MKRVFKKFLVFAGVLAAVAAILVPALATPVSAQATSVTLMGYGANLTGGGNINQGWTTGNLGDTWQEGEWVPYQLVINNVQSSYPNLAGLPDIGIQYDYTVSGARFVDLVKSIQIGTQQLTNAQAFPNALGNAMSTATLADLNLAQNNTFDVAWNLDSFTLASGTTGWDPTLQVNVPSPSGTQTVTDSFHKFYITGNQIREALAGHLDTQTVVIYFQLHESRTFVWSRALQSGYDTDPTDGWGGWLYGEALYTSDTRNGAGYVPGSSGQVRTQIAGIGDKTVPIPIPPTPTGVVSGVKWHDADGDGNIDAGESMIPNWPIHLLGEIEGLVFHTHTLTDANGAYSFGALTAQDWYLAEDLLEGWTQTYPEVGEVVGVGTGMLVSGFPILHGDEVAGVGWKVALVTSQANLNFGNRQVGHLEITKNVVFSGVVNQSAINETFTVHVTGPGGYSQDVTFTILNGVLQSPTTVLLENLLPGAYTVTEENPGPEWAVTGGGGVTVNSGQTATSTVTNTYVPGSLEITKIVDFSGVVNANSIDETFTVKVVGPSYPGAGITHDFVLDNGAIVAPNPWLLTGLIPGDYTITELDAGTEWTETVPAGAVAVSAGVKATASVTNTYVPGSLEITKVLVTTGYLFPLDITTTFTVTVTGPSYPGGHDITFHVVDGLLTDSPQTLNNLIPGAYTVSEAADIAWTATGGGDVTVVAGEEASSTITNTIKLPHTTMVEFSSYVEETLEGWNVQLTISDINDGEVPLTDAHIHLLANGTYLSSQPMGEGWDSSWFVGGDTNGNHIMDPGETWTWQTTVMISVTTYFEVWGHGTDPLGNPVDYPEFQSEYADLTVEVGNATRTWGFWKTHLWLVDWMFAPAEDGELPGSPHITSINLGTWNGQPMIVDSVCKYMALMWANSARNSDGTARTAIDQARIHTAQQALAAIMNYYMPGGAPLPAGITLESIANTLTNGNTKQIRDLGSALAAYNESGDDEALDPSMPPTGQTNNADPQGAREVGTPCEAYWNTPAEQKGKK